MGERLFLNKRAFIVNLTCSNQTPKACFPLPNPAASSPSLGMLVLGELVLGNLHWAKDPRPLSDNMVEVFHYGLWHIYVSLLHPVYLFIEQFHLQHLSFLRTSQLTTWAVYLVQL